MTLQKQILHIDAATQLPAIIDKNGVLRVLGHKPSKVTPKHKFFKDHFTVLPESAWHEIDRREVLGPEFILDQDGEGACVGGSSANATMRCRALRGFSFIKLSLQFLYDQINGGIDQGAIITDAMDALMQVGVCSEASYPVDKTALDKNKIPRACYDEAKQIGLVIDAYQITTWEEIGTAIMLDFIPVAGVYVGNTFENLTKEGVSPVDVGSPNHSIHMDGLKRLSDGRWSADMPNSWSTAFGEEGRTRLVKDHFTEMGLADAGYAIRAVAYNPDDPNQPPVAAI